MAASSVRAIHRDQQERWPSLSQAAPTENACDIEEGENAYKPGGFHPVYIGDIFHHRYRILSKIGYGKHSTVWLVRDLHQK